MKMNCPKCGAASSLRIVWGLENALRVLGNLVLAFITVWAASPDESIPLKRKCLRCGALFAGDSAKPPRTGVCPICGYDLTGNVSGRCPECGRKIGHY